MKIIITFLSIIFAPFAVTQIRPIQPSTTCQPVSLRTQPQEVQVFLTADTTMESIRDFNLKVLKKDDSETSVAGLYASIRKTDLLEEFTQQTYGWSPSRKQIKVYAVKLEITADEEIDHLIDDIRISLRTVTAYTICQQNIKL